MKHTQKFFIHAKRDRWDKKFDYPLIHTGDMSEYGYVLVGTFDAEIEVPELNESTAMSGLVAVMKAEKQKIIADAHVKAQNIQQQIDELLCIEFKGE